jgi:hypothetical protein
MNIDNKAKAIMLFSQLSNINYGYSAKTKQDLVDNFNRVLEDSIVTQKINELWNCDWQMAWGPALYCSLNTGKEDDKSKFHADNSMYVVKGYDNSTKRFVYVIAVAGTNALSEFEKKEEDIKVIHMVPWEVSNSTDTNQAKISNGSAIGLEKLLGNFDFGSSIKLLDFFKEELKNTNENNVEIITCGHSLGGALSPLVALKIKESFSNVQVSTYPTAGPTSGNNFFAEYLEITLGTKNYNSVINTNDMVPLAWESDTFKKIPTLYQDINVKPKGEINILINGIIQDPFHIYRKCNYTRIGKKSEHTFKGIIVPINLLDKKCSVTLKGDDFMDEAMYQHLNVYLTEGFGFDEKFACDVYNFLKSGG